MAPAATAWANTSVDLALGARVVGKRDCGKAGRPIRQPGILREVLASKQREREPVALEKSHLGLAGGRGFPAERLVEGARLCQIRDASVTSEMRGSIRLHSP